MKTTSVVICGKEYKLKTSLDPKYLNEIASVLDRKFSAVFDEDSNLTLFDASVLVSMEVIDESVKSTQDADNIRKQVTMYSQEIDKLKSQVKELTEQLDEQTKINNQIKTSMDLKALKKHLNSIE